MIRSIHVGFVLPNNFMGIKYWLFYCNKVYSSFTVRLLGFEFVVHL